MNIRMNVRMHSYEHTHVWTTIDTAKETLSIYHDSKLIEKFDYPLPKTSIDLSKIEL